MTNKTKKRLYIIISAAAALAVWQLLSAFVVKSDILLSSPVDVIKKLFALVREIGFWASVWFSLSRIFLGFLIALLVGTLLALLAGRFEAVGIILIPYMLTIKSVPVASFIVLALIWISSSELSVFISFLMVLPIIYTNTLSGIKNTDKKLIEMADVFRVPFMKRLFAIRLPSLRPFLISGAKVSLGLAWKAGIAAEVIGIADGSIGERLYYSKVYLDSATLLAWTAVIVTLSVACEKVFLFLLKKLLDGTERIWI